MNNQKQKSNQLTKYLNAFNLIGNVGPRAFKKLLSYFNNNIEEAWQAGLNELKQAELTPAIIESLKRKRTQINPDYEMEKLTKAGIHLISIYDEQYPELLKEIYAPPYLLYVRGRLDIRDRPCLGVVGTRKISLYGRQITPLISGQLAQKGITIVSGLAKGVDALAHRAALDSESQTIAVLGSAIDKNALYPPVNRPLAEQIVQSGALISEFPLGTKPLKVNFPMRNRIISGLCRGVLVIEAPERSGALITARAALEQNRDVFAVPGHILSPNSAGPHHLIKLGAKLVSQADDILEELGLDNSGNSFVPITDKAGQNPEQNLILKQLSHQPLHIDKIITKTKLTAAAVNSVLTLMEMEGKVKNLGRNQYVRSQ